MSNLMIVIGSVRPARVGPSVAEWVRGEAERAGGWTIDYVDLAELALPFMDEPNHPVLRKYTKQHTLDWSARVDAADAFIFVSPEYNHGFSPALKNALDFLSQEWWRKPYGVVSYGGISAGTRGITSLEPVLVQLGMLRASAEVELPFVATQIADGVFTPTGKQAAILDKQLAELAGLAESLKPLR
jgi:NAD(P)H-dependent FMN reductase